MGLKAFLQENNITAKKIVSLTGYNKNTITNWCKIEDDSKLPQGFILQLLKNFPDIDLKNYFPTHASIISYQKSALGRRRS